jgi:hypothetical protein
MTRESKSEFLPLYVEKIVKALRVIIYNININYS